MKPVVLFFARDYQAEFMPKLLSDKYEQCLVTLTTNERKRIEGRGIKVAACFEDEFDSIEVAPLPDVYLESHFGADRYLRSVGISDRRRVLQKEIAFWSRIFDTYKPQLVVNETIAIEMAEVMYIEARKRNIRYSSWMALSVKNHFYWQTVAIHNSLDESVFSREPGAASVAKAEEYMGKVLDGKGKPFYADNLQGRLHLRGLIRSFYWLLRTKLTENKYSDRAKNKVIFGDNAYLYSGYIRDYVNSIFRRYDNLKDYEQYEKVFYPLHFEPEAVLFYMAQFYDNQIATMEHICRSLKHNQVLVVKEHPQQPGYLLQKKFRDLKKKLSNIVFLPAEYSTYHLIQQCKLIITLTSTAGIESLIIGKPVVIMGDVFYDHYKGSNWIEHVKELKEFIQLEKNWIYPEHQSLKRYMAQVIENAFEGNPFPHADLYTDTNIRNIVKGIESELERELKSAHAV
jgi:Capsule polysaccharide biosynthesis protein